MGKQWHRALWMQWLIWVMLGVCMGAGPTTERAVSVKQIQKWVAGLGDGQAKVREESQQRLMEMGRGDLNLLREVVRKSRPLMPSQAVVLREIVDQVYLSGEKYESDGGSGFMGVRLSAANMEVAKNEDVPGKERAVGVVIVDRLPGFCGFRSLRNGDVVLRIVEKPEGRWQTMEDFRQAVQQFRSGAVIHLDVLRQGQLVQVPVKLDAKPKIVDGPEGAEKMMQERARKAEAYWKEAFAPLLEED